MTIMPGAEPISVDGSEVGVVLCHGYPSTPQSMRGWAEHLAAAGYSVRVPLLQHILPSLGGIAGDIKKPGVVELAYDRNPLKAMYSQTKLWKIVVEDLPQLRLPVLLFTSRTDHVIPPISWQTFLKRVGSDDVTQVMLEDSYHVATMDNDAELIFTESVRFIQRLTPQRP